MRVRIWESLRRILGYLGRLALIATLVAGGAAQAAPRAMAQEAPAKVKAERGQVLTLRLDTSVDSQTAKVGDRLRFHLDQPVIIGTQTVLPEGWTVPGHVTKVRPAGKTNCKDGLVEWKLDSMKAPDGTKVKVVSLDWRPYGPGGTRDKVHVATDGEKFGKALGLVGLAPLIAVDFALVFPMVIVMADEDHHPSCRAQPGKPDHRAAGAMQYAAVAQDVHITAYPGTN
jgi:hypothetical protein